MAPSDLLRLGVSCALAVLICLATAAPGAADGSVTPFFGDTFVLEGDGYRPGERVDIMVRAAGATHQFTATADARGRFRLDTGLAIPPLSSVEIEARDQQGQTQATITSGPGGLPGLTVDEEPAVIQDDARPTMTGCAP